MGVLAKHEVDYIDGKEPERDSFYYADLLFWIEFSDDSFRVNNKYFQVIDKDQNRSWYISNDQLITLREDERDFVSDPLAKEVNPDIEAGIQQEAVAYVWDLT